MSVPHPINARLHLLRAHDAPVIVVIRRGPSKLFHVIKWNTEKDKLDCGSWFSGKLYPMRCDVSFDGKWMVYLAMGDNGETWNGCCALPFLKTYLEGDNYGAWNGGGFWRDAKTLMLNRWLDERGHVPFKTESMEIGRDEDEGVLYAKMERDGWKRNGNSWGTDEEIKGSKKYMVRTTGDDGWSWRIERKGPTLQCFYRGYLEFGRSFEFRVLEQPDLLDPNVQWATFDARGHLIVARAGWIERYSPANVKSGRPGFRLDLNGLTRPPRAD